MSHSSANFSDPPAPAPAPEIRGLDSLRFVAAATVALGHGAGLPLKALWPDPSSAQRVVIGLNGNLFCGVAAVVVFFIISGLCIHYAAACGRPMPVGAFWIRRGVRILIPLLTAWALALWFGSPAIEGLGAVTWSVYCEIIYYALYPLLLPAFRRWGTGRVLGVSCLISATMILASGYQPYYWGYGVGFTWLIAAPAWLAGCWLAEWVAANRQPRVRWSIWWWRAGVWGASMTASILSFHAPIKVGYPVLLFPFQALALWWIYREILHFRQAKPWSLMEWAGKWSYSLYLVHNMIIGVTPLKPSQPLQDWMIRVGLILVSSLLFYSLVERPSHKLARDLSRRLNRPARLALAKA